uniref:Uncharacterized protein n=1 Tax=Arion vulgaris TaxID=1028688 RepID=A0A0B7A237_9EUPU
MYTKKIKHKSHKDGYNARSQFHTIITGLFNNKFMVDTEQVWLYIDHEDITTMMVKDDCYCEIYDDHCEDQR